MTTNIQKLIDNAREKYEIPGLSVSINFPSDSNQNDYVSGFTTINGSVPLHSVKLYLAIEV